MVLLPITDYHNERLDSFIHPDCREVVEMFPLYYRASGFNPPWIGYLVLIDDKAVGSCGFKGQPRNGKVEIAYWTFKEFENKGVATSVCRALVRLSQQTDPLVVISARTSSLTNDSSKILLKNGFEHTGMVYEDECGDIYEWTFKAAD